MRRVALMIGINKYEKLNIRFQLRGCVNDQKMMRQLITQRFGFENENIIWLTSDHGQEEDGQPKPTRENILDALDRLAGMGKYQEETDDEAFVREGDFVLISYTGHGSRLKEPPHQRDEADGYDSTIVPYDSDRPRPAGKGGANLDITDDEIFARLEKIQEKAYQVVLYFDCCHSGTISRDLTGEVARSLEEDDRYDGVERPWEGRMLSSDGEIPPKGPSGWLSLNDGYVLLAGCADDEVAREYRDPETGEPCGALTYHIVREMAQTQGQLTYMDVFQRARGQVNTLFPSQHPQIEGDWNRLLFELEEVKTEPFAKINPLPDRKRVTIDVGFAHGATKGSVWELRNKELADRGVLSSVVIEKVGAIQSVAVVEGNNILPDEVDNSKRAIQIVHALRKFTRPVAVDGPPQYRAEVKRLRTQMSESPILKLAENEAPELIAVLLPPRSQAQAKRAGAYAPEMGAIDVPTWVIVGRDRAMIPSPPHTILEEDALELTFANLETWARYINTYNIRPQGADPLFGKLQVELMSSTEKALPLEPRSGLPLVEHGQEVRLELTNHHNKPLYYAMYSMDALAGISRAWPPSGAREPLGFSETLPLVFPLELPENFPGVLNGARETLKIMVTPKYVNFDSIGQARSRGDHDLRNWFQDGLGHRGARMSKVKPLRTKIDQNAWTTIEVDYYLKSTWGGGGLL